MAYNLLDRLEEDGDPLVNQSASTSGGVYQLWDKLTQPEVPDTVKPTPDKPETWFGEFTSGFGRGVDQLQQMAYGGGALASSWLGADGVKDWFLKGYMANEEQIMKNPASVASYDRVDGMDAGVRYALATIGEFAPQVGETLLSGMIGATAGTAIAPGGGTLSGGIGGLVAKSAVKRLVSTEARSLLTRGMVKEFRDYLEGRVERSALSEATQALLTKETKTVAKIWGANAAIAVSAITKEAGSIYGDTLSDPDVSESDRRVAASVGGVIAAIPDIFVGSYIMGKFFPGAKATKAQVGEASGYLSRFMAVGGKEIFKVAGMESGQEFVQTGIELAAANWANPNTRHDFLNWTPEQWTQMIDAGIRGGIGGGVVGGSVSGLRRAFTEHPNPLVRSGMRDVLVQADNVPLVPAEVTQEHKDLEAVQTKIGAIEADINSGRVTGDDLLTLQSQLAAEQQREVELIDKLGLADPEPLVNQKEESVATPTAPDSTENPPSKLPDTDKTKLESLRALYAQEMPKESSSMEDVKVTANKMADKKLEVDNHIDTIAEGTEYGAKLKEAFTPEVVRMMAAENVSVATDQTGSKSYAADIDDSGKITLYLPSEEFVKTAEPEAMAKMFGGSVADAQKDYTANTQKFVHHELGHVADLINLRDEWNANKQGKLTDLVNQRWAERGARMREADPLLPETVKKAYHWGQKGKLSDTELGQELPRMAMEMAREGRTTEVTEALDAARRNNGKLNAFFRDWVDSLKAVARTIHRFLNPKTGSPELRKAYNDINRTLDKYGVINAKPTVSNGTSFSSPPLMVSGKSGALGPEIKDAIDRGILENDQDVSDFFHNTPRGLYLQRRRKAAINSEKKASKPAAPATVPVVAPAPLVNQNTNENETGISQPAQKASQTDEQSDAAGLERSVPANPRAERAYHSPVSELVAKASARARPGRKLAAIRKALAKNHPDLLDQFEHIVSEIAAGKMDSEAVARLSVTPQPIRGQDTADMMREYRHVLIMPEGVLDITRELAANREIAAVVGQNEDDDGAATFDDIPEDHYIVDAWGHFEGVDLVNEGASIRFPVTITNKLEEAQATRGIPETHSLSALGYQKIDSQMVDGLDEMFGENNWILKIFSGNAAQGLGVAFAEVVKAKIQENPDYFINGSTSIVMAQRLHDIIPSDRSTNVRILPGRELRVHIVTDNGIPKLLPSSTFWKRSVEEVDSYVGPVTPIAAENAEIRAAQESALDAVSSLPVEDRSGQMYGLDIVRLNDGGWGIVELNPSDRNGMSGFFAGSPLAIDAYLASLLGERPLHAELASVAVDAMMGDSLVNQSMLEGGENIEVGTGRSEVASKPAFSQRAERELEAAARRTMAEFDSRFEPSSMTAAPSRTRQRGGAGEFSHMTTQTMEYKSQPRTEAMIKAQDVLRENGLFSVIDTLQRDALALSYNLSEADEVSGVPNATLTALYQNAMQQIDSIIGQLSRDGSDRRTRIWLQDSFRNLETQFRKFITPLGRATSMSGQVDKVWNGYVARRTYVEPILAHLETVLGSKSGARFISMMTEQLNDLMSNYADRVVSRAQVIAQLQKIANASHTRAFQTEARKTAVMTEKRARNIVKKMAARMAEHVGMDQMGEEWADEAAKRMVKQMNGLPVTPQTRGEADIFNMAVNQVVRENADAAGLRGERTPDSVSAETKLAAILRNQALYQKFTETLRNRMIEEYKPEPGSPFASKVDQFFGWMSDRSWSEGMVESLVNKNLKELETTFAKIAQKHYGQTDVSAEKLREAVRKAMLEKGVENDGLLDMLLDDVDSSLRSRVEQARLDFFGSTTGVRAFLKNMQTTLAQKAKEHALSRSTVPQDLEEWLAEDFGIPNTPDMPMAKALQEVVLAQYNDMLKDERKAIVERMIKSATKDSTEKVKKGAQESIDKILQLVNLGVFRDEKAYKALEKKLDLPPYDEEIAKQAEALGETIAIAPNERMKTNAMQQLSLLIASQKGIKPYDMFMSGLYVNMLSGVSTHAVNVFSNTSSLGGYVTVAATQDLATNRGRNIPAMVRALYRASTGSALSEFKETFWTGQRLTTSGEKFFPLQNVLEMKDPVFKSEFSLVNQKFDERARKAFERMAKWEHGFYKFLGGKWVGRALNAVDVYFYKMAMEAAFAIKTGITETPDMRSSALAAAQKQMEAMGIDWNANRDSRRTRQVLANQIVTEWRMLGQDGKLDQNLYTAWQEAHNEALDATFRQDPKGLLGRAAKLIETWTTGQDDSPNPVGRLLIPFTRIAANVTNQMLEWTPYGFIRYGVGHTFGEDFRMRDQDGKAIGRDPKILIRATLGTLGAIGLMAMFGEHAEDEDPFLAIYDDGSKDPQLRKQMMDAGWRPKTIKVGKGYYNYSATPFAMVFSILGRQFDDFRDGKITSAYDIGLSSSAVAMLQAVTHQSFLSGLTDFMSAVDSPNPEKNMSRLMARMASAPLLPNMARQLDKWVNPTVQQAEGFWESFVREMPVVRMSLMPALNVFGEELKRDPGIDFLPGLERFLTMQKTDDPVYNLIGEKQITVPGYSKGAKLGDKVMTREQYYSYVQMSGPKVRAAIQAEIPQLRSMTKEEAQERVNDLAREIKESVRDEMRP